MRLRPGVLVMAMMSGMFVSLMPGRGRAQEGLPQQRIVYAVPGMDAVRVQRDLIYKRDNGTELKMDIYLPPAPSRSTPLPGVLFLHGGGRPSAMVSAKDWGVFVSYGQLLAASGGVRRHNSRGHYGAGEDRQQIQNLPFPRG